MRNKATLISKRLRSLSTLNWTSLRARMTVSYVSVTVGTVFSFLMLVALAAGAGSAFFPASDTLSTDFLTSIQRQAQTYAMIAAYQTQGVALDPRITFMPGQTHTIAVAYPDNETSNLLVAPYITAASPDPTAVALAMLVAPDGRLIASSYPSRYPTGMSDSALTTAQARAIHYALAGHASTGVEQLSSVPLGYATEPVWSDDHQPIGAIFLQVPGPEQESILSRLWSALSRVLLLLLIVTPIGVFFGWIATRGIVRRVQRLVAATTRFANGDYTQRVDSIHRDEIGQLERQFNAMASSLVEGIEVRQQLAEQNARLEERSRISRELHDAVSQDLFSLRMLADGLHQATRAGSSSADLHPHIVLLEQATGNMTREMRALLLELRPTELENLDLAGALRKVAHAYSTRLGIDITTDLAPVTLDVKAEHALLRIAQEALANAARHSGATLISLTLKDTGNTTTLTVTDNGEGFDTDAGMEGYGLGLRIMRERVEELHGIFDLKTASGQGVRITISLPQRTEVLS
ncbi:MAG TPA: sensor histidine kinase [Ktedonobacterales bacterium]|jgi:NarL family two-component system sensor histidine kinase LiaS